MQMKVQMESIRASNATSSADLNVQFFVLYVVLQIVLQIVLQTLDTPNHFLSIELLIGLIGRFVLICRLIISRIILDQK